MARTKAREVRKVGCVGAGGTAGAMIYEIAVVPAKTTPGVRYAPTQARCEGCGGKAHRHVRKAEQELMCLWSRYSGGSDRLQDVNPATVKDFGEFVVQQYRSGRS